MQAMPVDFDAFVAARRPALVRFAYLVSGERVECDDLVQEALAGAWSRWDSLAARGTQEAYLRRSITNGAVSRWRKLGRVVPMEQPVSEGPTVPRDDAEVAWELCAELPPAQRAAVVLRFYEDLSYAEIAVILECAEATARSHVHRALAALRERLIPGAEDG